MIYRRKGREREKSQEKGEKGINRIILKRLISFIRRGPTQLKVGGPMKDGMTDNRRLEKGFCSNVGAWFYDR